MFVQELVTDATVWWRCLGGHPEWKDTEITLSLMPVADGTVLRFSHQGWKASDGIFAACSVDWARSLTSLKAYVESGLGSPHPG